MADEPDADKEGWRSDGAETKESRSAHNREKQPNPGQVEQKEMLSKSHREYFALSPQLVKPHKVDIRNKRIDKNNKEAGGPDRPAYEAGEAAEDRFAVS